LKDLENHQRVHKKFRPLKKILISGHCPFEHESNGFKIYLLDLARLAVPSPPPPPQRCYLVLTFLIGVSLKNGIKNALSKFGLFCAGESVPGCGG
jgi:hypothetical protein